MCTHSKKGIEEREKDLWHSFSVHSPADKVLSSGVGTEGPSSRTTHTHTHSCSHTWSAFGWCKLTGKGRDERLWSLGTMARGCVARPLAASSLRIDCSAEEPVPGGCNCPPLLPTPLKPGRPLLSPRDPETQSRSLMRRGRREGGEEEESRRRSTAVFTCSQFSPPSSHIPTPTLGSFSASCQQTTTDRGEQKKTKNKFSLTFNLSVNPWLWSERCVRWMFWHLLTVCKVNFLTSDF